MKESTDTLNIQAWKRYMARVIDITIGSLFIGLIVGFLLPFFISYQDLTPTLEIILGIVVIFLYLLVEAFIISKYGTTLGKKLVGIYIYSTNGKKLDYLTALKRNLYMWASGMAFSLPLVSVLAMAIAYNKFTTDGITPWDRAYNIKVEYKPISKSRFITAIILTILTIILNAMSI